MVEKMSIERGLNWDVSHFTVPSATLKSHWNNPDLRSLLESETFDHIIIQEHSSNILTNADGDSGFYFGQIKSIIPSFYTNSFLFNMDVPSIEQFNLDNVEYPIEENIKEIIEGTANKLIPVGRAFKIFQDKYPQFGLLMEDDKHPNSNGSYLAKLCYFHI